MESFFSSRLRPSGKRPRKVYPHPRCVHGADDLRDLLYPKRFYHPLRRPRVSKLG